jgi:hypothetical protein
VSNLRWAIARRVNTQHRSDGTVILGAPTNSLGNDLFSLVIETGSSAVPLPGDGPAMAFWRSFVVPWEKDDIHASMRTLEGPKLGALMGPAFATRAHTALEWEPLLWDQNSGSDRAPRSGSTSTTQPRISIAAPATSCATRRW